MNVPDCRGQKKRGAEKNAEGSAVGLDQQLPDINLEVVTWEMIACIFRQFFKKCS